MSYPAVVVEERVTKGRAMNGLEEPWKRCGARLRAELGEAVFSSWFGRLDLESIANHQARFTVPTRFLKSWIESHYLDRIRAALNSEIGDIAELVVAVRSSTSPAPAAAAQPFEGVHEPRQADFIASPPNETTAAARAPARRDETALAQDSLAGSPLDRRLTFATFLVGRSNQLAYAAARRVTEAKAGKLPVFSPLYIHAAVGLGKTHLLAGARSCSDRAGAPRRLSHRREVHVWLRRGFARPDRHRLQGEVSERSTSSFLMMRNSCKASRSRRNSATRSTRWSTPGDRWSWPPTGRPAISRRSRSACVRAWPADSASK